MPLSALQATVLQSAILGGLSNILAQTITAHRQGQSLVVNWIPVLQFILFNTISAPPNYLWQEFLEDHFPAYPSKSHPKQSNDKTAKPKLSKRNTAAKLVLDQTLSASFNTILFSIFNRSLRAAMPAAVPVVAEADPLKAVILMITPGFLNFAKVDLGAIWKATMQDFWPVLVANWKLWPAVALVNFTMIKTVRMRSLVLALAGLVWRVYLSLVAAG